MICCRNLGVLVISASDTCNPKGLSIVLCGAAGQGIKTVESVFTSLAHNFGFFVFSTKEYMSRVRGGVNSTEIRIASQPVCAYVDKIDILVALDDNAIDHMRHRIGGKTIILIDKKSAKENEAEVFSIPLDDIAKSVGNRIVTNTVAVGLLSALVGFPLETVKQFLTHFFSGKSKDIIDLNLLAVSEGYQFGTNLHINVDKKELLKKKKNHKDLLLLNGTKAISYGAVVGGCVFISSYPMSPSTGVLTTLSQMSSRLDIVAEQAEDEIAAINMALGASYAGARSLVTTSGGGFALMGEGISLAGMIEQPVVVHVAQRPGPATGLPTRMEQGDLEMVLHAGHGEFPRVIFAPGSLEEGVILTHRAMNIADAYQIPVFVLTDQYYVDSFYSTKMVDISKLHNKYSTIDTTKDYERYELNDSGVSPRGIPGLGTGFVAVDSDEHNQNGRITEDLQSIRPKMVEKRLQKIKSMRKDVVPPTFNGSKKCTILVVCWGSTFHIVQEAVENLNDDSIGVLHFGQVYPLPNNLDQFFNHIKVSICVENNATGQFHRLIYRETGIQITHKILQYNGLPFSVESLYERILSIIKEEKNNG